MDAQNLAYALIQVLHNLGAATVVGGPFAAIMMPMQARLERRLAGMAGAAWLVQIASGALFGAVSFHYYGRFPDISGIAVGALVVKAVCACLGVVLAAAYVLRAARWSEAARMLALRILAGLGLAALCAAAFLRWFS